MNNVQYITYTIYSTDEIVVALLSQFEFEAYEEKDDCVVAYIRSSAASSQFRKNIRELCNAHRYTFEENSIDPTNWNQEWEKSFQPIVIDNFCSIRADFHPKNHHVVHDIIINPKMAFGTGHHETTFMMMNAMKNIDFINKIVLDYGCGTGVLSILAAKLGSQGVRGIDISDEAIINAQENILLNNCNKVLIDFPNLDNIQTNKYDIILANINRTVLIDNRFILANLLVSNGVLLLSGILKADLEMIEDKYQFLGFRTKDLFTKNDWCCVLLEKQNL